MSRAICPSYVAIASFVKQHYGFTPKTCWIAHVKHQLGYSMQPAWNRESSGRRHPCPPSKRSAIEHAIHEA